MTHDSLSHSDFSSVRVFSAKYFKDVCVELWWYTEDDGDYILTIPFSRVGKVQFIHNVYGEREVLREW